MNQAEAGVGMAMGQAQREWEQLRAHKVPWGAVPLPAASVGALTRAPGGGDQEVGAPHSVPLCVGYFVKEQKGNAFNDLSKIRFSANGLEVLFDFPQIN